MHTYVRMYIHIYTVYVTMLVGPHTVSWYLNSWPRNGITNRNGSSCEPITLFKIDLSVSLSRWLWQRKPEKKSLLRVFSTAGAHFWSFTDTNDPTHHRTRRYVSWAHIPRHTQSTPHKVHTQTHTPHSTHTVHTHSTHTQYTHTHTRTVHTQYTHTVHTHTHIRTQKKTHTYTHMYTISCRDWLCDSDYHHPCLWNIYLLQCEHACAV